MAQDKTFGDVEVDNLDADSSSVGGSAQYELLTNFFADGGESEFRVTESDYNDFRITTRLIETNGSSDTFVLESSGDGSYRYVSLDGTVQESASNIRLAEVDQFSTNSAGGMLNITQRGGGPINVIGPTYGEVGQTETGLSAGAIGGGSTGSDIQNDDLIFTFSGGAEFGPNSQIIVEARNI